MKVYEETDPIFGGIVIDPEDGRDSVIVSRDHSGLLLRVYAPYNEMAIFRADMADEIIKAINEMKSRALAANEKTA